MDRTSLPRLSGDESISFESENHLMDRRRCDLKVLLHVGLCRRYAMKLRVEVNVRQVLSLKLRRVLRHVRRSA